jgi:hypothetical protein
MCRSQPNGQRRLDGVVERHRQRHPPPWREPDRCTRGRRHDVPTALCGDSSSPRHTSRPRGTSGGRRVGTGERRFASRRRHRSLLGSPRRCQRWTGHRVLRSVGPREVGRGRRGDGDRPRRAPRARVARPGVDLATRSAGIADVIPCPADSRCGRLDAPDAGDVLHRATSRRRCTRNTGRRAPGGVDRRCRRMRQDTTCGRGRRRDPRTVPRRRCLGRSRAADRGDGGSRRGRWHGWSQQCHRDHGRTDR